MAKYSGATLTVELPNGESLTLTLKKLTWSEAMARAREGEGAWVDLVEGGGGLDISEVPFVNEAMQELFQGKSERLTISDSSLGAGAS